METSTQPSGAAFPKTMGTPTAVVTLNIIDFQALPALIGHTMQLGAGPAHVQQTTRKHPNDQLHVMRDAVRFRFQIKTRDAETYHPVGISFTDAGTLSAAPIDSQDSPFSDVAIGRATIEVTDTINTAPGTKRAFEFAVVIQRASDGALGVIDPYIENEN